MKSTLNSLLVKIASALGDSSNLKVHNTFVFSFDSIKKKRLSCSCCILEDERFDFKDDLNTSVSSLDEEKFDLIMKILVGS